MDPAAYCQANAAPPGSVGYYIARAMPAALRPLYFALQALCGAIESGIDECSEPNVALTKLRWWHEELDRLRRGAPRHPAARGLHSAWSQPDYAALSAHLDTVAAARAQQVYPDWEAVHAHLEVIGGTPWRLLGVAAGAADPPIDLTSVGAALALARRIAGLGWYARRGQAVLPETLLQRFGASGTALHRADAALFEAAVAHAQTRLDRALRALPAATRRRHPYAGVAIALASALLREIDREAGRLLEQRVHLTPLHRAWITWRTLRRERRQR